MKRARHYIETIRKSYGKWLLWLEEDEAYINQSRQHLLSWIKTTTEELRELDAQDVKDAILEHEDSIGLRIKRLDDYKILPTIEELNRTQGTTAQLPDAEVNAAIDRCRQMIEAKALDLIRVIRECEEYIKPKHPTIIKALADPLLCSYFYDNKKELEDYINFCLYAKTPTSRAKRAGELAKSGKLKRDYLYKDLQTHLKDLDFEVGEYKTWQGAARKAAE